MGNLSNIILMEIIDNSPKVIIYDNLVRYSDEINAWKPYESFPTGRLKEEELKIIEDLVCIELQFAGARGRRDMVEPNIDLFDYLYKLFYSAIYDLLPTMESNIYLIKVEDGPQLKSKIRSFKGLLPKGIKGKGKYIEKEISLDNKYSIMASIIELEKNNYGIIEAVWGIYNTCIICSDKSDFYTDSFLSDIPYQFMDGNEMRYLNFLKFVIFFCPRGDVLVRFGGDGGDQEITLQLFCKKEKKDQVLSKLNELK